MGHSDIAWLAHHIIGHTLLVDITTVDTTLGGIPRKGGNAIGNIEHHILHSQRDIIACILIGIAAGREAISILQHHIGIVVVVGKVEGKGLTRTGCHIGGQCQTLTVNPHIHLYFATQRRTIEGGGGNGEGQVARGRTITTVVHLQVGNTAWCLGRCLVALEEKG